MKNLSKVLLGTNICILLSFAILSASAYSPPNSTIHKNKGYTFKPEKTHYLGFTSACELSIAMVPNAVYMEAEVKFTYLKPVNDRKPDNTNYQLVRKESLKLHKAIRDC